MSDNQSDNSDRWGYGAATAQLPTPLEEAEAELREAQALVRQLEEQLEEAKRALTRAKGKVQIVRDRPTWKKIFCPQTITTLQNVYTICMQTGYSYALWNGRIYRAGLPGEGMMDTGMLESDIE